MDKTKNIDTDTPFESNYIFDTAMADGTLTYNKIKSVNYIHSFWDEFIEDDIDTIISQPSDIFTRAESFLVYQSLYMCEHLISAICDDNGIEDEDKKDFFLNYVKNHDIYEISRFDLLERNFVMQKVKIFKSTTDLIF